MPVQTLNKKMFTITLYELSIEQGRPISCQFDGI